MWEYEHAEEGTGSPAAVWRAWTDVANWGEWNSDIESIEVDGPFAAGTTVAMTPTGQDTVRLRLAEVRENERFVDEAQFAGVVIRTTHLVDPIDGGRVRVTYRMEITGPAADEVGPRLGPAITADFPDTIAALIDWAGR
jgi:uncharacterized protein YndB with AHSA1/START domain